MSRSNYVSFNNKLSTALDGSLSVSLYDKTDKSVYTNCEDRYNKCMTNLQHISSATKNNLKSVPNANNEVVMTNLTTLCGDHYLACAMKSSWKLPVPDVKPVTKGPEPHIPSGSGKKKS